MQKTASFGPSAQPNISKAMQSQPTQNMFVQQTVTNSSSQVHSNAGASLYRGPSASPAPRNGARHVPMQAMYPQAMHQGVVVQPFPQYQRQTFPAPPYAQYPQPLQPNYQYTYPSYYPVPTQRGAVGVSTGVGVGSPMTVQPGPNGPMSAPPGATQAQMPLAPGTVLTASAVPPGANPTVLGVAPNPNGQQVAVQSIVGVVQTTVPTQPSQKSTRRRTHAIKIIDPSTNKDIFEDDDGTKPSASIETEYPEPNLYAPPPIVMTERLRNIAYDLMGDMTQMSRDGTLNQTPIVSAISDGPSVEIIPAVHKPRGKKILPIINPKDGNSVHPSEPQSSDTLLLSRSLQQHVQYQSQQSTTPVEEVVPAESNCVQQQLPFLQTHSQQLQHIVSQTNTKEQPEQGISAAANVVITDQINSHESKAVAAEVGNSTQQQPISNVSVATTVNSSISVPSSTVALEASQYPQSAEFQQQQNHFTSVEVAVVEKSKTLKTLNSTGSQAPEISTNLDGTQPKTTDILPQSMQLTQETPEVVNEKQNISNVDSGTDQSAESNHVEIEHVTENASIETQNPREWQDDAKVVDYNTSSLNKTKASSFNKDEEAGDRVQSQVTQSQGSRSRHSETAEIEGDETDRAVVGIKEDISESRVIMLTTVEKLPTENSALDDEIKNSNSSNESKTNSNDITSSECVGDQSTTQQSLISYNEGQWSPNNPSGKKQYDKVQLLKLREATASRRQPEVSNVSILPTPNLMPSFIRNPKRVQSMVGSLSTNRGVAGSISGADGYGNKQASMSGVHGRGSMKGKNGMIHVNLSLHQDVKLNETDNAWRPRVLVKGDVEADPEAKTNREKEELVRRVRGILNKLTPEKFDALVEEIIKLKIDTPDKMEEVMVLVFEKAIDEPNFSVSYARLCHRLISEVKRRDERMESGTKTNLALFRAALLDKTEREFTQNVTKSKAKEKKLQPIIEKIAKCSDPTEKAELEAQLEEEERKIRRRSGGTVRFIGELFKISMLTGKIINSCIDALLNPNSEDQLECLCKLLTTVGDKFEQTPINTKESTRCYSLEKIMNRMQAIASKTDKDGAKVSSRVRFMLQDVIDLRRDKWQSKRNEAPKTMGQVEKEMKTEQLSSQYLNYAGSVSGGGGSNGPSSLGLSGKRDERGGGGGRYNDNRSGYGGSHSQRGDTGSLRRQQQLGGNSGNNSGSGMHFNSNGDDSTWHVQTSKGGSRVLDPLKLEGLSTANNFDNKKMGGVGLFVWSNGSRQSSTPTSTPTNSFAALSTLNDNSRSNDRDRSGPRNKGSYNKGSMERERYGMLPRSGSSQTSRESSSSRGAQQSRSALSSSTLPKTSSHSKYTQQQIPSSNRMSNKLSGAGSPLYPQRGIESYSHSNEADSSSSGKPNQPPAAVFEKLTDEDILVIKSVVSDMVDIGSSNKTLRNSAESCILRVRENQRCALLSYIMTDYLHLRHIGKLQRRYLGNVVVYLINSNFISVKHFKLAYKNFCEIASDLSLDIPDLWKYIIEFTGPLISGKHIHIYDLFNKQLTEEDPSFGKRFLKIYLEYCLSQIGPSFTRTMWKTSNSKWTDFLEESDVQSFIQNNKFECIESDKLHPAIVVTETKEDYAATVAESVEHLLKEEAEAECIIDYINGNIVDIDKHFIRSLATKLCDFAISYRDNSYKLETDCFQKVCIPVLQRYIDSKEEFELECLYSMQLLVARLEHPRGLLSDLFGELYDADVIPQDSFVKWRNSKDQSAGKGVAVKGLNPFFTHILSSETSDENN